MAETLVSVKKTSSSAGRPKGKKHYVILFRWEDVKTFEKDTDGITVTAFAFAEGKNRLLYMVHPVPLNHGILLPVLQMPRVTCIIQHGNHQVTPRRWPSAATSWSMKILVQS